MSTLVAKQQAVGELARGIFGRTLQHRPHADPATGRLFVDYGPRELELQVGDNLIVPLHDTPQKHATGTDHGRQRRSGS